jgi:hypothetical protein
MSLIHSVSQPYERLQPGQMVWLGVPVDLPREYHGKRLGDLPLQPIVLSILTEEDVTQLQQADTFQARLALRCRRTARLFQEAAAQARPCSMRMWPPCTGWFAAGCRRVRRWEKQQGGHLPTARVHENPNHHP